VNVVQLAPDEPLSPELVCGTREWKDDYPWLHLAFKEIGPGARAASDGWRVRIENELKTTLDFKVRPDGTAAVWCGMSGYDFHHDPTPKELFEGLAKAYRREVKRVGGGYPARAGTLKMSAGASTDPGQTLERSGTASIATRSGPVEIARDDLLLHEIGGRGRPVLPPELRAKALARLAPPEWPKPQPPVRASRPAAEDSLTRTLGAVLLPHVVQLMLIFAAVTALTSSCQL
jgi:hypothetical protein